MTIQTSLGRRGFIASSAAVASNTSSGRMWRMQAKSLPQSSPSSAIPQPAHGTRRLMMRPVISCPHSLQFRRAMWRLTTGAPRSAARCFGPESLPMNTAQWPSKASNCAN